MCAARECAGRGKGHCRTYDRAAGILVLVSNTVIIVVVVIVVVVVILVVVIVAVVIFVGIVTVVAIERI